MAMTFDATLKDMGRESPRGFLAAFDRVPTVPVRLLNVDLSTVTTAAGPGPAGRGPGRGAAGGAGPLARGPSPGGRAGLRRQAARRTSHKRGAARPGEEAADRRLPAGGAAGAARRGGANFQGSQSHA